MLFEQAKHVFSVFLIIYSDCIKGYSDINYFLERMPQLLFISVLPKCGIYLRMPLNFIMGMQVLSRTKYLQLQFTAGESRV